MAVCVCSDICPSCSWELNIASWLTSPYNYIKKGKHMCDFYCYRNSDSRSFGGNSEDLPKIQDCGEFCASKAREETEKVTDIHEVESLCECIKSRCAKGKSCLYQYYFARDKIPHLVFKALEKRGFTVAEVIDKRGGLLGKTFKISW